MTNLELVAMFGLAVMCVVAATGVFLLEIKRRRNNEIAEAIRAKDEGVDKFLKNYPRRPRS